MDPDYDGMQGTDVAQVKLFLSLHYNGTEYCCASVDWFSHIGDSPDEDTGDMPRMQQRSMEPEI